MLDLKFLPFLLVIVSLLSVFSGFQLKVGRLSLPLWGGLGFLAVLVALSVGSPAVVTWQGAGWLLILLMATSLYRFVPFEGRRKRWIKEGAYLLVLVLSYQLLCHRMPGFNPVTVYSGVIFGSSVFPMELKIYFDQAMAGLIMFGILVRPLKSWREVKVACWRARHTPIFLVAIYSIGVLAWLHFDVKFSSAVVMNWVASLFFVCVLQEIFFRLLIQKRLEGYIGGKGSETVYLAAVITAVVYTLTHMTSLIPFPEVPLVFLSGLLFGHVYAVTRRVEFSILVHFLYSAVALVLFNYP